MSKPLLQQHSFFDPRIPQGTTTRFVEMTHDVASGLGVALELIYSSNIDRDAHQSNPDNAPPILGEADVEKLMRFAITASNMLADAADEYIEWKNSLVHQEAKACPGS